MPDCVRHLKLSLETMRFHVVVWPNALCHPWPYLRRCSSTTPEALTAQWHTVTYCTYCNNTQQLYIITYNYCTMNLFESHKHSPNFWVVLHLSTAPGLDGALCCGARPRCRDETRTSSRSSRWKSVLCGCQCQSVGTAQLRPLPASASRLCEATALYRSYLPWKWCCLQWHWEK